MSGNPYLISAADLTAFASSLLQADGLVEEHALAVAEVLVWADLRGVETHGVSRLPLYLRWLRTGEMNPSADVRPVLSLPALVVLEGDRCPGAVGMRQAVRAATSLARRSGVGIALLRGTTHTGALGFYTSAVAEAGLIGWATAASGPNMGYHGAKVAAVSTAPLSIAAPRTAARPILLDMAAGAISVGSLIQARKDERSLPEGAAMDANGRSTRDPRCALTPLPLGGPKGSGLALMSELICSVLTGAPILAPTLDTSPQASPHRQNAMVLAIDTVQLTDPLSIAEDTEALVRAIKELPPVDGGEVLLPGERGWSTYSTRSAQGIPLSSSLREDLALAASSRVTIPWG